MRTFAGLDPRAERGSGDGIKLGSESLHTLASCKCQSPVRGYSTSTSHPYAYDYVGGRVRRNTQGIAIVLVLLVSAIALMTFLFSSAALSLSSRGAAAGERNSTQALLAADSGLNTLRARASTDPYQASDGTFKN